VLSFGCKRIYLRDSVNYDVKFSYGLVRAYTPFGVFGLYDVYITFVSIANNPANSRLKVRIV